MKISRKHIIEAIEYTEASGIQKHAFKNYDISVKHLKRKMFIEYRIVVTWKLA